MTLSHVRSINLLLTAIGTVIFAAVFFYVSFAPKDFDERSKDFAIAKVRDKVDETFPIFDLSKRLNPIAATAPKLSPKLEAEVEGRRDQFDAELDIFIGDILTATCKLDCTKGYKTGVTTRSVFASTIARYDIALERLENIIVGEYDEVMTELRADLQIFAGSNAVVLFFSFFLSLFRRRASAHILPISIALTGTTLLMVPWYIFGQNWVMTLVFSDYWGWSYSIFLIAISCLLVDIAVNAAKITSAIYNLSCNAIGSAFHFIPC